jgi:DNA-directed RNA polymerase subunit alpha
MKLGFLEKAVERLSESVDRLTNTVRGRADLIQRAICDVAEAIRETAPPPDPATKENDILSRPIDSLPLSVRAKNCLHYHEVETIGQLIEISEIELLRTRTVGQKSLQQIKEALADLGLALKT